ncbi:hypothetical protein ACS0TY_029498 [Phlomoides rotata]
MASSPEAAQSAVPPPSPPSPPPAQSPPAATSPPATPPPPPDSSAQPPPQPVAQSPPLQDNSTSAAPVFSPPAENEAAATPPPLPDAIRSPPRARSPSKHGGQSESSTDSKDLPAILGIIFGGVLTLVVIMVLLSRWQKRRNKQHNLEYGYPPKGHGEQYQMGSKFGGVGGYNIESGPQYGVQTSSPSPSPNLSNFGAKFEFSYEALVAATNGFDQANLLGQGGFGYVHKGVLPNGQEVAVKSLKSGSGQGEREFQAEVEIISRVHHRHLVSLVGYCIARGQRMLVYEFVPNGTLEYHLHRKDAVMDWAARRRIATGSAKGLAYLHEDCHPRIIHRDIKTANILIDFNFEAMVADFGLAKLTTDNHTHVSTRVMGTFGYLAPEYASSGKLSEKSDVFSFGVMLLELITGRRPIDPTDVMEDSLVDWARPIISKGQESGDYSELVDPRLENNYNREDMARMISCAAASIRHSARRRPRMSQIVRALDGNLSLEDLNEGVKGGGDGTGGNNPYDTKAYNADIMKFRMMVMSSDSGTTNQSMGSTSS